MAQCSQSAVEFIQNAFGPTIAVLCSHDAEVLAQKNNLSFVEMVRPFCKLTSEAHIRDPAGQLHTVHNMRIHLNEMNMQPPSITLARKMMNDTVGATQPPQLDGNRGNVITVGSYDLQLSASTPWFESYRENFLQLMPPSDHEFLKHNLGCMLVVSTNHADPMDQFMKLSQQQHHIQHSAKGNSPKWLCPNIFKYFVLVHDNTEGEEEKAEAIYQSMKSTYGSHACHLLRINSRSLQAAESTAPSDSANHMPDPWSQYLNKTFDAGEVGDGDNISQPGDCVAFPDRVTEADPEHVEGQEGTKMGNAVSTPDSEVAVSITDGPNDPSPEDVNMTEQQENTITNNEVISHPLADTNNIGGVRSSERLNSFDDDEDDVTRNSSNTTNTKLTGLKLNSGSSTPPPRPKVYKPTNLAHGLCLTLSDHDRLRIFIHEFVVRGLLPYVEKMIRTLNESLARRKGLHRSLMSVTRTWFAGNKQAEKVATTNAPDMGSKYLRESPELQMRRLGDLSFLVQMYELAYTSYHTAKRDFNNDQAWMHFAGSLEMAAVSAFMLGSMQKAYPQEYMERSVHTYLTTCKKPSLATRAIILSSEILKARGMYAEAAMEFIRMTGEDSDLRSALFLEQAAHCFINMRRPMVRKYAFHMILAGHRYSKAAQRKHALRAYCQALQVYKGKRWSLAEDHINFTIGRQSFNLKQLENATAAFRHLLTNESRQPVSQQGAFLKEYLFVFKSVESDHISQQLLSLQSQEGQTIPLLPQLPLPVINKPATRVLLGLPQKTYEQGTKTAATSLTFESIFNRAEMEQWRKLEEMAVMSASKYRKLPDTFRHCQQLLHGNTDNSNNPLAVVKEPMTVEIVLENPLKVPLVLTNITLLWKFVPMNYENVNQENPEQQPTVMSNEADVVGGKVCANQGVIDAETIAEVSLIGQQIKPLHLTITPHQTGELHILGIAYSLSAQPTTSSTTNQISQKDVGNKEVPDSPKTQHKRPASFASSVVSVQGRQDLDIQGPRLNSNKEERCSVVYGPDRRLDLVVAPPMPSLEVAFTDFPSSLLCGEVSRVLVEFSNRGAHALHKLLIATNNPEFFSFGTSQSPVSQSQLIKQSNDQLDNSSSIYRTIPLDEKGGECSSVKMCNVSSLIEIDLPDGGALAPGNTLQLPMWVRGPDKSGVHEINMMFYYESVEENPKIRHRTVYHTAVLHTSNSVSLTASARRAHAAEMPSNKGKDLSLLLSLAVDNLNQVHDSNITEFSIEQVSCASTRWAAECLGPKEPTQELKISGGESQRFCLKACQYKNPCNRGERSNEVVFSNITFGKCTVDSAVTPCCDFYFRSLHRRRTTPSTIGDTSSNKSTPSTLSPVDCPSERLQGMEKTDERWRKLALESSIAAELSLIVLWKAFVVDDDGHSHTLVGQHQVAIEALNKEATTQVITRRPIEQQYIKFVKEPETDLKHDEPSEDVMTQLLKYTLGFPETKVHNFDKARTCVIPIQLNLYNCCATNLEVLIETAQDDNDVTNDETTPEQSSPAPTDYWSSMLPPASSTNFAWVGHMSQEICFSPQCSHQSMLWACFSKPGVFNLNSIKIMARSPTTEGGVRVEREEEGQEGKVQRSGFTRQRNTSPNLVTVVESDS